MATNRGQAAQFEEDGYFIQRNVIPRDLAIEMRGVIKNTILMPEPCPKKWVATLFEGDEDALAELWIKRSKISEEVTVRSADWCAFS